MKVVCNVCKWEGTIEEVYKHEPAMDELPAVDACPSCGATNTDAGMPSLIFI